MKMKKLVSISPFINGVIKDYAVFSRKTDSVVAEEMLYHYFFGRTDAPVLEILEKELYSSENLNSAVCGLLKYASLKKPELIPCVVKFLSDVWNDRYEIRVTDRETKEKITAVFDTMADMTEDKETRAKWKALKQSAENCPDIVCVSELYEYFSDNAVKMNRYYIEKTAKVLLDANPCENSSKNRMRLIQYIAGQEQGI